MPIFIIADKLSWEVTKDFKEAPKREGGDLLIIVIV